MKNSLYENILAAIWLVGIPISFGIFGIAIDDNPSVSWFFAALFCPFWPVVLLIWIGMSIGGVMP